jgi:uncharacterized protein YqgC (DUF456 family)
MASSSISSNYKKFIRKNGKNLIRCEFALDLLNLSFGIFPLPAVSLLMATCITNFIAAVITSMKRASAVKDSMHSIVSTTIRIGGLPFIEADAI